MNESVSNESHSSAFKPLSIPMMLMNGTDSSLPVAACRYDRPCREAPG